MPGYSVWPKATKYSCPLIYSQISPMPRIRAAHEHSIRRFKTDVYVLGTRETDRYRTGCSASQRCHTPVARVCAARECCILQRNAAGRWGSTCNFSPPLSLPPPPLSLSLSLSLTHTHTHTTAEQRNPMQFISTYILIVFLKV